MKSNAIKLAVCLAVVVLAGCAAKPVLVGDSVSQHKNVIFPKVGQSVHVVNGGLVHLRADYKSKYGFKLKQPVSIGFTLGRLNVTTDDVLFSATLQEQPMYCTVRKVYSDPLTGPQAIACFIEGEKSAFIRVKAAPGQYWFTKELPAPVPFEGSEVPSPSEGRVLKRELIFEGYQNGGIFFTEKEYEFSLGSPSKARPVLVKIDAAPVKINVNGLLMNVVAVTANSLTYSIEKAWD